MKLSRNLRYKIDGLIGPLPTPQKWVFIVGCYNSGTTLLHKMLSSHPDIGYMDREGQFYTDELPMPRKVGLTRLWAAKPDLFCLQAEDGREINVKRLKRQWGRHFNDVQRPVLLEKSPTNAGRTRWLQKHFENAHFIGIIRNGYAVAEGIRRKAQHPIDVAARQWQTSNDIMLKDFEHLQKKILVLYEELTADPNAVYTKLIDFLALDPAGTDLSDQEWKIHERYSKVKNMNAESIKHLSKEDITAVQSEAGDLLARFGYNDEQ